MLQGLADILDSIQGIFGQKSNIAGEELEAHWNKHYRIVLWPNWIFSHSSEFLHAFSNSADVYSPPAWQMGIH